MVCVVCCVCVCFQGWRILQKYFRALSVASFTGPENVLRQEGNQEDRRKQEEKSGGKGGAVYKVPCDTFSRDSFTKDGKI